MGGGRRGENGGIKTACLACLPTFACAKQEYLKNKEQKRRQERDICKHMHLRHGMLFKVYKANSHSIEKYYLFIYFFL